MSWLLIFIVVFLPLQTEDVQAAPPPAFVWTTHVELSYVQTSGNTKTRAFAGKLELAGTGTTNSYSFRSSGLYGRTDGTETSNRIMADGRWERRFSDRAFFFLNATFISNKFAGYNYRLFGGPGLGVVLLNSPEQTLRGLASLNYSIDKYYSGPIESKTYGNLELLVEYQRRITGSVKLKNSTDYLTSLEDSGRYFINADTALEVSAGKYVSLGVSYAIAWQGMPPIEGLERLDTTFFTSLIFDF